MDDRSHDRSARNLSQAVVSKKRFDDAARPLAIRRFHQETSFGKIGRVGQPAFEPFEEIIDFTLDNALRTGVSTEVPGYVAKSGCKASAASLLRSEFVEGTQNCAQKHKFARPTFSSEYSMVDRRALELALARKFVIGLTGGGDYRIDIVRRKEVFRVAPFFYRHDAFYRALRKATC